MEGVLTEIGTNVISGCLSKTWNEFQFMIQYNKNIKKLKEHFEDLQATKDRLQQSINEATNNAEDIALDVLHWMKKVDEINKEVTQLLEQTRDNNELACFFCKFPKLHSRYRWSKQASAKIIELVELKDSCKFNRIGYSAPPNVMPFATPQEFDGFESRKTILNNVMEALNDDSIPIIGICGMAGVGKTTLVKEIADEVKAAKLFDEVAMAVLGNDVVVSKVQEQLGESLKMTIEEKTDRGRADHLYKRLMDKNKRILVILDDLWKQNLDLHDIGIPVKGERNGLKVIFTSRFIDVCHSMKAKPFEVNVLSEEESWRLFMETAELADATNNLKSIAKDVAKECGGLPLSIMVVSATLKNKDDKVWEEVLEEFKESSVTSIPYETVNKSIGLSYNFLDNDSKSLLLLCSLFPEDFDIELEDLVRYSIGLQLFKNVEKVARVRNKVFTVTDNLKSSYLLLSCKKEEMTVKLHDVVRDFCLSIASSGENVYMVKHAGLEKWPHKDSHASTAISLAFEKGIDKLPSGLEYPKLQLMRLHFENQELHTHTPDDFFKGMNEIKVLYLVGMNTILPSLHNLVNLRMLSLEYCYLHGDVSVIESQEQLEVLSLQGSHFMNFPNIAKLSNLKSLDLRRADGPPLPTGILVRLTELEELFLGSYFQELDSEGEKRFSAILKEISSLLNLQLIEIVAYNDNCLEKILESFHPEKMVRFSITNCFRGADDQFGKLLSLEDIKVGLLKKDEVRRIMLETEDLRLQKVQGLTNFVRELDGEAFANLKKLKLTSCTFKYFIDATGFLTSGGGVFVSLEELYISDVENLEELCHGNLPIGSFPRLISIFLANCPTLKHLWGNISIGSFARLREFIFLNLPALEHLWGDIKHPSLGNLQGFWFCDCGSIKSVFLKSSTTCLRQLKEINIVRCQELETVVSNGDEDDIGDVEFPMLKLMRLESLPSLRSFGPESSRRVLFEKVMLPKLETLTILLVNGIRGIIDGHGMPSTSQTIGTDASVISEIELVGEEYINKIVFPKLRSLQIAMDDDNFQMLCFENVDLQLPLLTKFMIQGCNNMIKFCVGRLIATNLKSVEYDGKIIALEEFVSLMKARESRMLVSSDHLISS